MRDALLAGDLYKFSQFLNEAWQLKRLINPSSTPEVVQEIYEFALGAGATSGKLLGAGGGGYIYFLFR